MNNPQKDLYPTNLKTVKYSLRTQALSFSMAQRELG